MRVWCFIFVSFFAIVGCERDDLPGTNVVAGFEGLSAIDGRLVFDDREAFQQFGERYQREGVNILDALPHESFDFAYQTYMRSLDRLEALPEEFDDRLVYNPGAAADTWLLPIVDAGLLQVVANANREFVIGDTLYRHEVGKLLHFALDRASGAVGARPVAESAVTIDERDVDAVVARRGTCEEKFWTPSGDCNDDRVRNKLRVVNSVLFAALEARTNAEKQKDRRFSSRCKWVGTTAVTIWHYGDLWATLDKSGGCDNDYGAGDPQTPGCLYAGGNFNTRRSDRSDITTPVATSFSFPIGFYERADGEITGGFTNSAGASGSCVAFR